MLVIGPARVKERGLFIPYVILDVHPQFYCLTGHSIAALGSID
jgi:hypothetical protein